MPELPEVETVCRQLKPKIKDQTIANVVVRNFQLRLPITENLPQKIITKTIKNISRRGKYIIIYLNHGSLIIHLGMTGTLQLTAQNHPPKQHDHVDITLGNGSHLIFNDPRRFGVFLWAEQNPLTHKLLLSLGPEPLTDNFSGSYLYSRAHNKKTNIKNFIMNGNIVAGIGNIYANEALFASKINPLTKVDNITITQFNLLAEDIKIILTSAIEKNGTTFRDFTTSDGSTGSFQSELQVYGRSNQPCYKCGNILKEIKITQRTTVYCPNCQH